MEGTRDSKEVSGMAVKGYDIHDLAKKNPRVDLKQLQEAQDLVDELRKRGFTKPRYEIEPPYGSRPSRARSEETESGPQRRTRHRA